MPTPPLGFTGKIQFSSITPGSFVSNGGGGLPHANGDVTVQIDGADHSAFSVVSLETLALRSDPDAPPSSRAWETVDTVNSAGPIHIGSAEALLVTVGFTCSLTATQASYSATAMVMGNNGSSHALLQIPISATVDFVGQLAIDEIASPLLDGISPGETKNLSVVLRSTLQHDAAGTFGCDPSGDSAFTSPQVSAAVPARGTAPLTLPVTCATNASSGFHDNVKFVFQSADASASSQAFLRLQVWAARSVTVTSNFPSNLVLQAGAYMPGKITAQDSGGESLIAFQLGELPQGISIEMGPPHTVSGGAFPDASRTIETDITIRIDPEISPLPPVAINLNWTVPADGSHVAVSGTLLIPLQIGAASASLTPFCIFADPPGSASVGPNAWGLKDGRPRKSNFTWSGSGAVNGGSPLLTLGTGTASGGIIPQAFAKWSAAAPTLIANQVLNGGDIGIGTQGLGAPAAGGGVVLGQTSGDGSSISFNNNPAVAFVPQVPGSPSLLAVAIHEIGHALGLLHNTNPASVMFPFGATRETLGPEDIGAIRALYSWAPQTPVANVGTESGPALCACGSLLVLAWRGIGDDHNIWFATSTDGKSWVELGTIAGAASSEGPSLAWDGTLLWMAWKGVPGDQGLYFASWDLLNPWKILGPVANTGSSCGPSITVVGQPTMVWKGVDGDAGIYYSQFAGGSWAPQQNIGGVGTSDRPAVSADPVTGVPRMVWKGIDGDDALYTSTLRNLFWQPQQEVSWIVAGNGGAGTVGVGRPGSALGPGLTTSGGRLSMVWRGVGDDQELWFTQAAPDAGVPGQNITEWSTQANVAGFASSSRPAIAVFAGNTFVAWKGAGDDHRIFTTFI